MNFILCSFNNRYKNKGLEVNNNFQLMLLELTINQLNNLYRGKDYSIHILTQKKIRKDRVYTYDHPEMEQNNYDKLLAYKLLKESAIFLDCDMLLLDRFEQIPPITERFNLFLKYMVTSGDYFPFMKDYPHYNSGIIVIDRPGEDLYHSLARHKEKFRMPMSWNTFGYVNDEYPTAYAIHTEGRKMVESPLHNVSRDKLTGTPKDWRKSGFQSIHYIGKDKSKLLDEYATVWGTNGM